MNSQEIDYLVMEKKSEGKSEAEAFDEIREFKQSQIEFKKCKSEIKKRDTIIQNLKDEIKAFKIKIEKGRNKILIEGLKHQARVEKNVAENPSHILRLINQMIPNKEYCKRDLVREFCIPRDKIEQVLIVLIKLNKLEVIRTTNEVFYKLK